MATPPLGSPHSSLEMESDPLSECPICLAQVTLTLEAMRAMLSPMGPIAHNIHPLKRNGPEPLLCQGHRQLLSRGSML